MKSALVGLTSVPRLLCIFYWPLVFRLLDASLQFSSEYSEVNGLRKAASVLTSIGVMTLLLAMLEIIENFKTTLGDQDPIPSIIWTFLHLGQYAAFILSTVFTATGRGDLHYASAVIVACLFISQVIINGVFLIRLRQHPIQQDYNPDNISITLSSTPFLTVRVTYMLLSTFVHNSIFTSRRPYGDIMQEPNVYAAAFMQYLMEFVVFAMFVYAGFVMPRPEKKKKKKEEDKTTLNGEDGSQLSLRDRGV